MIRRRLRTEESGLTLIELLVAAAMSVVLVGAAGSMLISAVRGQPRLSEQSQNVSEARYELERLTRELRNGIRIDVATPTQVSFLTRVRRTSCGGPVPTDPEAEAIKCEVTYQCSASTCTRSEAEDGEFGGTPVIVVRNIDDPEAFCFVPSGGADKLECGEAVSPEATTYVGVNLHVPNPEGPGALTVSDGASLRSARLAQ